MKSERQNGPTPNGGAYSIAYFFDSKGRPTDKGKAVRIEVIEYREDGTEVARTYANVQ